MRCGLLLCAGRGILGLGLVGFGWGGAERRVLVLLEAGRSGLIVLTFLRHQPRWKRKRGAEGSRGSLMG